MCLPHIFLFFLLFLGGLLSLPAQQLDLRRAHNGGCPGGAARTQRLRKTTDATPILELPANFQETSRRATWDFPLQHDLSQCAAIRLVLRGTRLECVRQIDLYLRFEATWYVASLEPTSENQWEEIILPRHLFQPEKGNASWFQCDRLRIALWKRSPGAPILQLQELNFLPPNVRIALLEGRDTSGDAAQRKIRRLSAMLCDALARQGLYPALIPPEDTAPSTIGPYQMLLLPVPLSLTPQQRQTTEWYLHNGGKVGLFYLTQPTIASLLHFPAGKYLSAASLPGGIAQVLPNPQVLPGAKPFSQTSGGFLAVEKISPGTRVAAWWGNQQGGTTRYPAVLEGANGFWMTHTYQNQSPEEGGDFWLCLLGHFLPDAGTISATELSRRAKVAWEFATEEQQERNREGMARLVAAQSRKNHGEVRRSAKQLLERLKMPLPHSADEPIPISKNEIRGIYSRYPNGLPGMGWAGTMAKLKEADLNALLPLTATPYSAFYPSEVVPTQSNQLISCLQEAQKKQIRIHLWFNCLNVEDAPRQQKETWSKQHRLQKDAQGNTLDWLCPNHPDNLVLLSALLREMMSKLPADGIHFDCLRYPQSNSCFCDLCKEKFLIQCPQAANGWPQSVAKDGPYVRQWRQFRQNSINQCLTRLCVVAANAPKRRLLSAAVYPDWELACESVGQDWRLWCQKGWLSFVSPMNYCKTVQQFSQTVATQSRQIQTPARMVPAIGVSVHKLPLEILRQQITASRKQKNAGCLLFDLSPLFP